jgi:pimeloyl-ACP methyl ester carboxylesterase
MKSSPGQTIARTVLATAPNRFALCGLSMGGYIAFEMMRQEPDRIERLAFLDTSALSDTPEQTERRLKLIAMAQSGEIGLRHFMAVIRASSAARRCGVETSRIQNDG